MNFGGGHSAHCLRYGQAPRIRPGAFGWPSAPAPKRARGGVATGGARADSRERRNTPCQQHLILGCLTCIVLSDRHARGAIPLECMPTTTKRTIRVKYYARYRDRGMPHAKALKAVARKRLKAIYAIMRDKVPYVA